jgi:hypothetical protein
MALFAELMRSHGDELIAEGDEKRGELKGLVRGRAEGVLRILTVRGVPVDEAARQRILSCTELATLDLWFDRALSASHLGLLHGSISTAMVLSLRL